VRACEPVALDSQFVAAKQPPTIQDPLIWGAVIALSSDDQNAGTAKSKSASKRSKRANRVALLAELPVVGEEPRDPQHTRVWRGGPSGDGDTGRGACGVCLAVAAACGDIAVTVRGRGIARYGWHLLCTACVVW